MFSFVINAGTCLLSPLDPNYEIKSVSFAKGISANDIVDSIKVIDRKCSPWCRSRGEPRMDFEATSASPEHPQCLSLNKSLLCALGSQLGKTDLCGWVFVGLCKSVPAPQSLQQWRKCHVKVQPSGGEGVITSGSKCQVIVLSWSTSYWSAFELFLLDGHLPVSSMEMPTSHPCTKYHRQLLPLKFLQLNWWDFQQGFPYVRCC